MLADGSGAFFSGEHMRPACGLQRPAATTEACILNGAAYGPGFFRQTTRRIISRTRAPSPHASPACIGLTLERLAKTCSHARVGRVGRGACSQSLPLPSFTRQLPLSSLVRFSPCEARPTRTLQRSVQFDSCESCLKTACGLLILNFEAGSGEELASGARASNLGHTAPSSLRRDAPASTRDECDPQRLKSSTSVFGLN